MPEPMVNALLEAYNVCNKKNHWHTVCSKGLAAEIHALPSTKEPSTPFSSDSEDTLDDRYAHLTKERCEASIQFYLLGTVIQTKGRQAARTYLPNRHRCKVQCDYQRNIQTLASLKH